MLSFIKNIFNYNQKELNRIGVIVDKINQLEDKARVLKDTEFIKETEKFKKQLASNETTLDEILPWAFALVREVSRRVLGLRHYDEQLIAGIALHEGKVAEQKTGEGKTLSATAPLYLNALLGKGAHLVTVNDYLARRDTGWMGPVFEMLGLTVASMISEQSFMYDGSYVDDQATDDRLLHLRKVDRKEAYAADITYGINSEFGFDYLRDNMARSDDQCVQRREFYYAIIDEVDSVLIDEARTPHIISAPFDEDISKYYDYAKMIAKLSDEDYVLDEKLKTVHLNEAGVQRIEKILGVQNVYEEDYDAIYHIEAALKAHALFKIDKDYIVKDGEVIIVDEFTGRLLNGRRFSEGLHQAIEAKEGVQIKRESRTLATVSLQNYFRMYEKLAGMTGTAQTEAEEFNKIYKLETLVIPTHVETKRKDHPDYIYKTEEGKFNAVAEHIAELHKQGRPVLIGTTSIEKNERLSRVLTKKGVPHELLNAKNHEREAHIIAQAGLKGAVTVATNMAGRGVDIVLGGEPPSKYERDTKAKEYEKADALWQKAHDEVVSLGGLYVISTERHESRRIDNQLRGRAGRQGDPGDSRFFVSLEDDLMRIFGGEQVARLMNFFNLPEDQPLEHSMVSKALEQAQVKVESFNFDVRKNLVEYDDVLNKQREILYLTRRNILFSKPESTDALEEEVFKAFDEEVAMMTATFLGLQEEGDIEGLKSEFAMIAPDGGKAVDELQGQPVAEIEEALKEYLHKLYLSHKKKLGNETWLVAVKYVFLEAIDKYWTEHLTGIENLREGINLRGYGQLDPLTEYKNEAFSMFENLLASINSEFIRRIFNLKINVETSQALEQKYEAEAEDKVKYVSASQIDPYKSVTSAPEDAGQVSSNISHVHTHDHNHDHAHPHFHAAPSVKKPGRNDPCWCGSGKKYKKCHYPN